MWMLLYNPIPNQLVNKDRMQAFTNQLRVPKTSKKRPWAVFHHLAPFSWLSLSRMPLLYTIMILSPVIYAADYL